MVDLLGNTKMASEISSQQPLRCRFTLWDSRLELHIDTASSDWTQCLSKYCISYWTPKAKMISNLNASLHRFGALDTSKRKMPLDRKIIMKDCIRSMCVLASSENLREQ